MGDVITHYFSAKRDRGKLDMGLFPAEAYALSLSPTQREMIVRTLEYGLEKGYARDSWRTVPDALPRYRAAAARHHLAIQSGELVDPESTLPHYYHWLTNCVFIYILEAAPSHGATE